MGVCWSVAKAAEFEEAFGGGEDVGLGVVGLPGRSGVWQRLWVFARIFIGEGGIGFPRGG